jgi:hypothetical protein
VKTFNLRAELSAGPSLKGFIGLKGIGFASEKVNVGKAGIVISE